MLLCIVKKKKEKEKYCKKEKVSAKCFYLSLILLQSKTVYTQLEWDDCSYFKKETFNNKYSLCMC